MDLGIAGKRALVLGASRGLGMAVARLLAEEGVEVIAAARTAPSCENASIRHVAVDLSDPRSVEALIAAATAGGGIDILVNNGGGPAGGPAFGQKRAAWTAAFETMALPLFAIADALLPAMIEKKWGRIVTIGSSGNIQPIPGLALSNSIRNAVSGWSKTLAAEVARHGVTVNMVLPGRIDTDRVRELDTNRARAGGTSLEAVQEASRKDIPAGRYGEAEEFAAMVAFLASARASYVTGSMIRVDGGFIRSL